MRVVLPFIFLQIQFYQSYVSSRKGLPRFTYPLEPFQIHMSSRKSDSLIGEYYDQDPLFYYKP